MASSTINLGNFNLGGLSQSKYQGSANSAYKLIGLDVHSEPGIIKVNQQLVKDSGSTIDDLCKVIISCSDGHIYFFGSTSGKIWKKNGSTGVYSLEATSANGGILDAVEDQGKIYYTQSNKVGRWVVGTAWSTRNDSWQTLNVTDTTYHPMRQLNFIIYIGDGYYVNQIEDDVYTDQALDLSPEYTVTCFGRYDTRLLIGTRVGSSVNKTQIFQWDTWSQTFSNSDPIPELGINAFLESDNSVLVSCGTKGNIYSYNGGILVPTFRIPGDWTVGKTAIVNSNAVSNYGGINLFGLSNSAGNPTTCGVYGLGNTSAGYPTVMSIDYVISTGSVSSIEIGAMLMIADVLYVSWKDGSTYGVDKLDASNKFSNSSLETRLLSFDRKLKPTINKIWVYYRTLPANTQINIYYAINDGSYAALSVLKDANRKMFYNTIELKNVYNLQVKILPQTYQNTAPEIDSIMVEYEN